MQPTTVFTASAPGMIYLNGRFAGEVAPDRALMTPVAPYGALYVEYRPLVSGYSPLAFKCVFSGGSLLPDSISDTDGVSAIQWPGGILEIEIRCPKPTVRHFMLGGLPCIMEHDRETILTAGELRIPLPDGALTPRLIYFAGVPTLLGDTGSGGQYLVALTADLSAQTGFLAADRIDSGDGNILHTTVSLGDTVGHARLEQWMIEPTGLQRLSSEPIWSQGSPLWPQTAEETMLAAVEAGLAGLMDEADNYFAPVLADTSPLNAISDVCDLCLPMKYGLLDSRPCIGLMHMENDCLATVTPLYYRAELNGGMQGPWSITWLSR